MRGYPAMTNCKYCGEPLTDIDVLGYHVKCAVEIGLILNWTGTLKHDKAINKLYKKSDKIPYKRYDLH